MSEEAPKSVAQTGEEPTRIIEIGGKKIEIGPSLSSVHWNEINTELEKLNKTLESGEKEWRIFSKEEYQELGKQIIAIRNEHGFDKDAKITEYLKGLGIERGWEYWSSTDWEGLSSCAYFWDSKDGEMYHYDKDQYKASILCVREV